MAMGNKAINGLVPQRQAIPRSAVHRTPWTSPCPFAKSSLVAERFATGCQGTRLDVLPEAVRAVRGSCATAPTRTRRAAAPYAPGGPCFRPADGRAGPQQAHRMLAVKTGDRNELVEDPGLLMAAANRVSSCQGVNELIACRHAHFPH